MTVDLPPPLDVPLEAFPHLIAAVVAERERIAAIDAELTAREEAGEVDPPWPDNYDVNDLWLYEMIRKELSEAMASGTRVVDLGIGKIPWFLTMIIPAYVSTNRAALSASEVAVLKYVYDQKPTHLAPFPPDL